MMNIIQALEQLQAFLMDFAPVIATYYLELLKNGVDEDVALYLATELQSSVIVQKEKPEKELY